MRPWIGFAAAGLSAAAYVAYAAAHPAAQAWARGFHRGPRSALRVALTFDDGPSQWTPAVLEELARYDARATFFMCGRNIERTPHLAQAVLRAGHEIGNHTYDHPCLLPLSARAVREQVERTQRVIEDRLGVSPTLFRPPFGVRSPALRSVLDRFGLVSVQWSVIGCDWMLPADRIAARVLRGADAGGVLCLHDGDQARPDADRRETVQSLEQILPGLRRRGLHCVTAGEMNRALAG